MPTMASLPAFLKSCGEVHFLLQKAVTDYFLENWWHTTPQALSFLAFTYVYYRGRTILSSSQVVHSPPWLCGAGMAEFLLRSLPVWHLKHRALGDSPFLSIDERSQLAVMRPEALFGFS